MAMLRQMKGEGEEEEKKEEVEEEKEIDVEEFNDPPTPGIVVEKMFHECLDAGFPQLSSGNHENHGKSLKKFHAWENHGI